MRLRRWVLGLVILTCACAPRGATTLSLDVEIADGVARPTTVNWVVFDPFGLVFTQPGIGIPAGTGAKLGTLAAQLADTKEKLRMVVSVSGTVLGYTSFESRVHANVSGVLTITPTTMDEDGDGIPDEIDNCPTVPNPDQASQTGMKGNACSSTVDGGACGTPIVALHAGGPSVTAPSGVTFVDDGLPPILWDDGTPYALNQPDMAVVDTSGVTCGAPSAVYETYRFIDPPNSMTYTFENLAANHAYTLRLHFADLFDSSAGQRQFNVYANNQMILPPSFDIIGTVGAPFKALVEEATAESDASGMIALRFQSILGKDAAIVNGIEILP